MNPTGIQYNSRLSRKVKASIFVRFLRTFFSIIGRIDRADFPIFRVISPSIKRKLVRCLYKPVTFFRPAVVGLNGLSLKIPKNLEYSYLINEYEAGTQAVLDSCIKPGMVVIDVGANIGYLTLLMATLVGQSGKVYAVEPETENLKLLRENIQLNGFNNVRILPFAAGSRHGFQTLYLSSSHLLHSLYVRHDSVHNTPIEVFPLDEIVDQEQVDLAKIDAEGAEIEVLNGMKRILSSNPKIRLIVEWNPPALHRAGHSSDDLLKLLLDSGFDLKLIHETNNGGIGLQELDSCPPSGSRYINLYAVRRN